MVTRRPRRVVLWGGRPGYDVQFGSPADQRRERKLRHLANIRRWGNAMTATFTAQITAIDRASRPLARLAGLLDGVDEDTMLERSRRRAGRR
jgi:hypothetical protein